MRDFHKIIKDDIDWLFNHYELDIVDIEKSVEKDRMWDYVLKLRMLKPKEHFHGIKENADGTVDCVPPWSLEELLGVVTKGRENNE